MTVKELIEVLSKLDPTSEVCVRYPSGDYWKRDLAREPRKPMYESVKWSGYHEKDEIIDEDSDGSRTVVLI